MNPNQILENVIRSGKEEAERQAKSREILNYYRRSPDKRERGASNDAKKH